MTAWTRVRMAARRVYVQILRRRRQVHVVRVESRGGRRRSAFILGAERSGTTPLRLVLDSHPKVTCPAESQVLIPMFDLTRDDFYGAGFAGLGFDGRAARLECATFLRNLHEAYADAVKPESELWIDKSPQYAVVAEDIAIAFPDAKFVAIVRHPLPLIESLTKDGTFATSRQIGVEEGHLVAAHHWVEYQEAIGRAIAAFPDRFCVISYEELCEEPEATIRRVCAHLELEFDPGMLDYGDAPHTDGLEGTKAYSMRRIERLNHAVPRWAPNVANDAALRSVSETLGYRMSEVSRPQVDLLAAMQLLAAGAGGRR